MRVKLSRNITIQPRKSYEVYRHCMAIHAFKMIECYC